MSNTTYTQVPLKLAPDTKEMKVLAAFLAAMHDQSLDGAKMREAMLWSLGLQPAATNTQYAINRAIQLCEWIAETPHQRGSINGLAAQVRHELSALQTAAAQPQTSELSADANWLRSLADARFHQRDYVSRMQSIANCLEAAAAPAQASEPSGNPAFMIYQSELCYKSDADDQSFGMWCPVTPDYRPPFPDNTKFYAKPAAPARAVEPLTEAQKDELWYRAHRDESRRAAFVWYFKGIADAERAHGIGIPATTPKE